MKHATLALLLLAAFALAACGGDDDGDSEEAVAETTAETTPTELVAEEELGGALLLIMDASGSMREALPEGGTRLEAAKSALREVVAGLPEETEVGLQVLGGGLGGGCEATELIAPVEPLDPDGLSTAIDGFEAGGETPIGRSLEAAGTDLPEAERRSIVLVSDGEDTCAPPDPCDVAEGLEGQGIEVAIETVGFALGGNEAARTQLTCIAEATGGEFHDVADAEELSETLGEVSGEAAGACEVPEGTGGDWEGEWDSAYGPVSISQTGDEVRGCFYRGAGQMEGTVSGQTWEGTWDEPAAGNNGTFSFRLSEDGNSWVGGWDYGDVEVSADDGSWNGTRVEAAP